VRNNCYATKDNIIWNCIYICTILQGYKLTWLRYIYSVAILKQCLYRGDAKQRKARWMLL